MEKGIKIKSKVLPSNAPGEVAQPFGTHKCVPYAPIETFPIQHTDKQQFAEWLRENGKDKF